MGVHPRSWVADPEHLPVWEDRQLGGCAGLALGLVLLVALGVVLGLVWLAVA